MDIQKVISQVGEPLRRYNYIVELPAEFGNAERLKYQAISVGIPSFFDFEIEKMQYGPGFDVEFPSAFGDKDVVEIEFWEDADMTVYNYFYNWREKIVNLDTDSADLMNFRLRKEYVRDITVYTLDLKGRFCGGFKVREAFPVRLQKYDFSYGDSDIVRIRVEFRYRDIVPISEK